MIYLLYGEDYQIKKYIDEIKKENNIDDMNINRYELDAYNYKDVIMDMESVSLFEDKKIVIISNALIFTSSKTTVDSIPFEKYIDNYNPNTIAIFIVNGNLDERKKVTKLIRKKGVVKEFTISNNPSDIITSLLDDYKMDNNAKNKFIELVGNDIYSINNELDKLKIYKGNNKNISLDDVINITTNNIEADLFKLMDAIIDGNKEKALEEYHNMLLYNTEPIQIIVALANKYRLMYQVKRLYKKGYTEGDIAKELKQNPKYIFVINKISRSYDEKYLLKQIKELADLDFNIKSGRVEASLGLELYIIKK